MNGHTLARIIALLLLASETRGQELRLNISPPVSNGTFELSFPAQSNVVYDVHASTNVPLQWHRLKTLRAGNNRVTLSETQSTGIPYRFFRAANLSGMIVVEGYVQAPDGYPVAYVIISNSLTTATTHSDFDGHYFLPTHAANDPTNLPFTLFFTKPDYRPTASLVVDPSEVRVDYVTVAGQPNNDFTNRIRLPNPYLSGANDSGSSDVEPGEPGVGERSVWYSYVPERDGTVQVYVETRRFRPTISIYTGDELGLLQPRPPVIYSNYVEHRNVTSGHFSVYAGEELQIRIAGEPHSQSGGTGGYFTWWLSYASNFTLQAFPTGRLGGTITIEPPPNATNNRYLPGTSVQLTAHTNFGYYFAGWSGSVTNANPQIDITMDGMKLIAANFRVENDNFEDAHPLAGVPAFGRGVNRYATREAAEPEHCGQQGGHSVWWRWTAPSNMSVRLNFAFTNFTALLAVYTGPSASSLTNVANNAFARNKRQVDFDAIAGTTYHIAVDGWHGDQTHELAFTLEDVFEARYVLGLKTNGVGSITLTPPADGNDQFGTGETVMLTATSDVGYRFEAWADLSTGQATDYTASNPISVTMHSDRRFMAIFVATNSPPRNDNFATRSGSGLGSVIWAVTVGATSELNEPAHGGAGGASVWWDAYVPAPTNIVISSHWASFNGAVAVYKERVTGPPWGSLTNLILVAAGQFGRGTAAAEVLSFPTEPFSHYRIAVDTYDGSTGTAELRLRGR